MEEMQGDGTSLQLVQASSDISGCFQSIGEVGFFLARSEISKGTQGFYSRYT